ncbi:hypothetical protein ACJX0J_032406, partial [Zea mays]
HNLGNNLDAAVLEQIHNFLFIDRIACSASLSVVDFGIVVAIFAIIGLWSDSLFLMLSVARGLCIGVIRELLFAAVSCFIPNLQTRDGDRSNLVLSNIAAESSVTSGVFVFLPLQHLHYHVLTLF